MVAPLPTTAATLEHVIHTIRGHRVMLDSDLANIYGVTTKRLNQQVQRNLDRFPQDFAFQLTYQEVMRLRLQFATLDDYAKDGAAENHFNQSNHVTGHRFIVPSLRGLLRAKRGKPYDRSTRQSRGSGRDWIASACGLAMTAVDGGPRNDGDQLHQFKIVFDAIQRMMAPTEKKTRPIGFRPPTVPQ